MFELLLGRDLVRDVAEEPECLIQVLAFERMIDDFKNPFVDVQHLFRMIGDIKT